LQVGFLIEAHHPFPSSKRAARQLNQKLHLLGEVLIPRHLWGKPQVRAPRLELVGRQDSADCFEGNAGHDAIGLKVAGEFGAVPLGQGTPKLIRPFTSQLDHIQCDLGRKDRRPTRTRPLVQTCCPLFAKAPGPFAHMAFAQANLPGCGSVTRSLCEQQERTGSSEQA
jgi:hypothetical protein